MSNETAKIRQFLQKRFNDAELNALCADYFPDVYDDFTEGMRKSQKVQLLLDHCQNQQRWPFLMAALEQERPVAYTKLFETTAKTETIRRPYAPLQRNPRKIFISHAISHAPRDVEFAHRLADDLRIRGWKTWIAPDNIPPGVKWQEAIDRGLEESGVLILVLTSKAAASPYVRDETYTAIRLEKEGKMRFFPLLVEACDAPPSWNAYQHISFENDYKVGLHLLFKQLQPETMEHLTQLYGQLETAINSEKWGEAQSLGGQIEAQYSDYQDILGLIAQAIEGQKKKEIQKKKLASLYQQLQKAIEKNEWGNAQRAGQQIRSINQNYRDVTQLLIQVDEYLRQREQAEQLAMFYEQLETAILAEEWEDALKVGQKIQAVKQGYRDVAQLLTQVNENLHQGEQEKQLVLLYQQLEAAVAAENWDASLRNGHLIQALDQNYRDTVKLLTQANEKAERKKQLSGLYQKLQASFITDDWENVLGLGEQIQRLDKAYRNVPQLLAEARKKERRREKKEKLAKPNQRLQSPEKPREKKRIVPPDMVWWVTGTLVAMEAFWYGSLINPEATEVVNSFFIVPVSILLLILFRPIHWYYVATFVIVLQIVNLAGSYLGGRAYVEGDARNMGLIILLNTVAWALLAAWRSSGNQSKQVNISEPR